METYTSMAVQNMGSMKSRVGFRVVLYLNKNTTRTIDTMHILLVMSSWLTLENSNLQYPNTENQENADFPFQVDLKSNQPWQWEEQDRKILDNIDDCG